MPTAVSLVDRIPEIIGELELRTQALCMTVAEETAGEAETLAPEETGALKQSIEARAAEGGAGVYAEWYWFFPEFGTTFQGAHPFMTPAFKAAYLGVQTQGRRAMMGL